MSDYSKIIERLLTGNIGAPAVITLVATPATIFFCADDTISGMLGDPIEVPRVVLLAALIFGLSYVLAKFCRYAWNALLLTLQVRRADRLLAGIVDELDTKATFLLATFERKYPDLVSATEAGGLPEARRFLQKHHVIEGSTFPGYYNLTELGLELVHTGEWENLKADLEEQARRDGGVHKLE